MPFHIIRNDITKVRADAIVNTANPKPVCGSGTDSAVYRAAGEKRLLEERRKIGDIETGEVAVTPAFRLHAKYIIHTVGPVWTDGTHGEFALLASCYRKSLLIARQLGCKSIAFPLISTGVYGFPKDRALAIALGQISAFLRDTQADEEEMEVLLVVFDKKAFDLSAGLTRGVRAYIDENYVRDAHAMEYGNSRLEDKSTRRRRLADRWNLPFGRRENTGRKETFHGTFAEGTFFGSDEPVAAEEPAPWTAGPASGESAPLAAGPAPEEPAPRTAGSAAGEFAPPAAGSAPEEPAPWTAGSAAGESAPLATGPAPEEPAPRTAGSAPEEPAPWTAGSAAGEFAPPAAGSAPEEPAPRTAGSAAGEFAPPAAGSAREEPAPRTADSAPGEASEEKCTDLQPDRAAEAPPAPVLQSAVGSAPPVGAPGAPAKDTSRRPRSLQDIMSHLGESFQECLLRLIDERGLTDVQVYKRANIDRKLFSKIRCNASYSPHRRTAIALAIALQLNRDEMTDLLRKAGIALSPGSKFDLIISYCVENHIYDLYTINAILFDYDQPLLGA